MPLSPSAILRQAMAAYQRHAHTAIERLLELGSLNDERAVNARQLILNLRSLGLLDHAQTDPEKDQRDWHETLKDYRRELSDIASGVKKQVDDLPGNFDRFVSTLESHQTRALDAILQLVQSPDYQQILRANRKSQPGWRTLEQSYLEIRDECVSKLARFDADQRYRFLRERQFATEHYPHGFLRRALDRWLAGQIDYQGNRQKETLLLEMKQRNEERMSAPLLPDALEQEQMSSLLVAVRDNRYVRRSRTRVLSRNEECRALLHWVDSRFHSLDVISRCLGGSAERLFESLAPILEYKTLVKWQSTLSGLSSATEPELVAETQRILQELLRLDAELGQLKYERHRTPACGLFDRLDGMLFSDCTCDSACGCKEPGEYRFDAPFGYAETLDCEALAEDLIQERISVDKIARRLHLNRQDIDLVKHSEPARLEPIASTPDTSRAVLLSEKMGAMGIVDELRGRRALVDEYLDLPGRRVEIANQIRRHYQGHGISFENDLIERGVRDYFSSRLIYESPSKGALSEYLTHLIAKRAERRGTPAGKHDQPVEKKRARQKKSNLLGESLFEKIATVLFLLFFAATMVFVLSAGTK